MPARLEIFFSTALDNNHPDVKVRIVDRDGHTVLVGVSLIPFDKSAK